MTDIASPSAAPSSSESDSFDSSDSFDNSPDVVDEDDLFDEVKEAKPKQESKPKPKEPKEEPKPAKRFVKANVNGREESVDEETLIRHYQKERAAEERFQRASQIEKQTANFIEALKADPAKVLSDKRLGVNMREVAMKILSEQVEEEIQDPMERKFKSQEQKLKEYEDRETKQREEVIQREHQERHQRAVNERKQHFGQIFEKAMELSPLAKSPETAATALKDMALYYRLAKSQGYEATPDELAAHVQQKQMSSMYSAANTLSGDELISFLGPDVLKKIRQADLARIQGKLAGGRNQVDPNDSWETPNKSKEPQYINPSDMRFKLRNS